jgi:hypothetical protein
MIYLRLPPGGFSSTEISLSPWFKDDLVISIGLNVGKGKRERGRAANNFSFLVILGSVARTPLISEKRSRVRASWWDVGITNYCAYLLQTYMYLFSALFHGTTHPRCVHTAFNAKSARFFCSSRMR